MKNKKASKLYLSSRDQKNTIYAPLRYRYLITRKINFIHAIHMANSKKIAAMLHKYPYLANQTYKNGKTPLYYALAKPAQPLSNVIKTLLKYGSNPNQYMRNNLDTQQPTSHTMPLQFATQAGHVKIVDLLLASGANQYFRTEDCSAPVTYTTNNEIRKIFARYQCEVTEDGEILCPICMEDLNSNSLQISARRCGHLYCHKCDITLNDRFALIRTSPCPICGDKEIDEDQWIHAYLRLIQ